MSDEAVRTSPSHTHTPSCDSGALLYSIPIVVLGIMPSLPLPNSDSVVDRIMAHLAPPSFRALNKE